MIDRVLISGGGTGGHIFPALSIAAEIRRRNPQAEILFVGAQGRGVKLGCAYYQENASCVATFRNCIVWDNKDGFVGSDVAATLAVDHSDVQGGFEGEGNINADPKLYGPTKKRAYHLRAGSPCAGTGENRADMGCFPFDAPGLLLMVK